MRNSLILLFLILPFTLISQQRYLPDVSLARTNTDDLVVYLNKGYHTFYLENSGLQQSDVEILTNFLLENEKAKLTIILRENSTKDLLNLFNKNFVVSESSYGFWEDGARIKIISTANFKENFNVFNIAQDSFQDYSQCRPYNWLTVDSLSTLKQIEDFANILAEKYGVVPDVIASPYIFDEKELRKTIEQRPVYEAVVLINGEDLQQVGWKEYPGLETCGLFRTQDSTLSPQKRGYMFSPDIYNFTDKNTRISGPKTFRAYKYEIEEKIRYELPLTDNTLNLANPEDKSTFTDISFIDDPVRGMVADFNGNSSYIDIRSEIEGNLEELSISAWIKPREVDGSFSLIGKGEAFSAKLYFGRLQFTTPAIKDHTTAQRFVVPDKWHHIAYVYIPEKKLYFYLNGELIDEVAASSIEQTDHALLIGTNLWGQHYNGLLSDLKIWDRALSDQEVLEVSQASTGLQQTAKLKWWWVFMVISSLVIIVAFIFYTRRSQKKSAVVHHAPKKLLDSEFASNSISLLNGFKVRNELGEDITYKFSPKRKELLILIIIYTLKEGGISSRKMSDILWPGFNPKSKKNNRSTQIKEIRKIFENQLAIEINFIDKKWLLSKAESVHIDLFQLNEIIPGFMTSQTSNTSNPQALTDFSSIVKKGPLLPQLELEWLDKIKTDYNNAVLDILTPYLENSQHLPKSTLSEILDAVLVIDPLFELAVKEKIALLMKDGKLMSAKKVEGDYRKLYESFYGEPNKTIFISK